MDSDAHSNVTKYKKVHEMFATLHQLKCWTEREFLLIIRLEARRQANIGFTFERALAVFTRSDITPPKVNRFG